MTEHKICKGCKWNKYPFCSGTKMIDEFMRIDNLKEYFVCGRKDLDNVGILGIVKKSDLELRVEVLESKVNTLEEVRK